MHRPSTAPTLPSRESGAIGIMFAAALIILFGFFALALDLSQLYNRKMELQTVADTVALAAAPELDGTADGITHALEKAAEPFTTSSGALTYLYGKGRMSWSDDAMTFASSPDGPWQVVGDARNNALNLLFVKVDTTSLNAGAVTTLFARAAGGAGVSSTSARAIAGRSAINVTPLGICAMRDEARRNHNGELEEYGFRRGVAYNLMDLNRSSATAGATFIVNPLPGTAPITSVATLAPFVCTGTMAMARITGGPVTVSSSFPLGSLYSHFNSRFGSYGSTGTACDARTAPADVNVKEFIYNTGAPWMSVTPQQQSAVLLNSDNRRWTVAGPDSAPAGTTDAQFGPLWSYAKAVPYSAYQVGVPEPDGGYSTYAVADWATLYNPGQPKASTSTPYPSSQSTPTPYSYTSGTTFFKLPPSGNKTVAKRRVLNLPLLACPVSGSQASVLGIGKFFMTVAATSAALYGEFAGLVPEQSLGTRVVLYP